MSRIKRNAPASSRSAGIICEFPQVLHCGPSRRRSFISSPLWTPILHFEPSLGALSSRSDVVSSIKILSLGEGVSNSRLLLGE